MRRNEEQGAEKDDKGISMPKPALFAVGYMESDWIRYAIQDERGRYWTGRGFTKDERKALAYADDTHSTGHAADSETPLQGLSGIGLSHL